LNNNNNKKKNKNNNTLNNRPQQKTHHRLHRMTEDYQIGDRRKEGTQFVDLAKGVKKVRLHKSTGARGGAVG
jgi:hypothetical protein